MTFPPGNFSILHRTWCLQNPRAAAKAIINTSGVPLLPLAALIYSLNLFTKRSSAAHVPGNTLHTVRAVKEQSRAFLVCRK